MKPTSLALAALLVLPALAQSQNAGRQTRGENAAVDTARVVLLGTGMPRPDPERSGPSTAVVVGNDSYIVDAGAGVVRRAVAAAIKDSLPALRVANLKRLFLTHLHSDHTIGLPDIILTPAVTGRRGPLEVWGPEGTQAMVTHILEAYQEDIRLRVYGLEHGNWAAYHVIVHEIKPGVVYRDSNVTVTAFPVHHGSWPEALGYRFDTRGRSIVISGDEAPPLDTIARYCDGCDVLVHEVYSAKGLESAGPENQEYFTHFHTSGIELGEMAQKARPRLLVLTHWMFHGQTPDEIVAEVKSHFPGKVAAGADLDIY